MSGHRRRIRRFGRSHGDSGAAAIEFALVFPLFVMLTFGMISAGFAFFYDIQLTQAARDAARFGSTIDMDTVGVDAGLAQIAEVAAEQNGWSLPDDFSNGGEVCTAYIQGSIPRSRTYPNGALADTACFDDGDAAPDPRIQVTITRDGELNAVLLSWDLELRTTTVIPWERGSRELPP